MVWEMVNVWGQKADKSRAEESSVDDMNRTILQPPPGGLEYSREELRLARGKEVENRMAVEKMDGEGLVSTDVETALHIWDTDCL